MEPDLSGILGRLIPAGTGLAYHNTRRKQGRGEDTAGGRGFDVDDSDVSISSEQVA